MLHPAMLTRPRPAYSPALLMICRMAAMPRAQRASFSLCGMLGVQGVRACGARKRAPPHMSQGRRRGRNRLLWGQAAACSCAAACERAGRAAQVALAQGEKAMCMLGPATAHLNGRVLDHAALGDVAVVLLGGQRAAALGVGGSDLPQTRLDARHRRGLAVPGRRGLIRGVARHRARRARHAHAEAAVAAPAPPGRSEGGAHHCYSRSDVERTH